MVCLHKKQILTLFIWKVSSCIQPQNDAAKKEDIEQKVIRLNSIE